MTEHEERIRELACEIATFLDEKKALDIKLLHVYHKTILADYFIIAHTTSTTHLKALGDELEYKLEHEKQITASGRETSDSWTLIDFDSIIVHLFIKDARDTYKLEKLWGDAEEIPFTTAPAGAQE